MFDGKWLLYIFIIMLLFSSDGEIEGTELAVLLASTLAVLITDSELGLKSSCSNSTT